VKLDPTGPGRYAFTVDTSALTPGRHRLSVRAIDAQNRPWFGTVEMPIVGKSPAVRVFDAGTALQAPAAVDARAVYAGGWDGKFYAVDRATMLLRWSFQTGSAIIGQAGTDDDAVYFGSTDQNIYALDKKSGRPIWKFPTNGPIQSHVRVAEGTVFVGSGDHNLYAIDAKTGKERWRYTMPMHLQARPAVANGMVYVGAWDNTFYALDARTGELKWTHKTTGPNLMYSPAISSPAVVGENVVITYPVPKDQPDAPQVLCLNGRTGETVWGYRPPESTSSDSSPTSDGKNVYLATISGQVYALDAATGKLAWTSPLEGTVGDGSAVAHAGQVICNTLYGVVEGHDAATGRKLWSYKTGGGFQFSRPAVDGKEVYQTSFDGTLTAITIPAK
jgi:outer membrane protein assembly factor BamB